MLCEKCSDTFVKKHSSQKFCSLSCSASFNNSCKPKRKKREKAIIKCATCGSETERKKFCSKDCHSKGMIKYETEEKRYKADRAIKNEAWHRYNAKKRNQTPIGVDIKELQRIYRKCPEGHEVDHIIPISRGGLHEPSNLQYLTVSENRKKWAHIGV